MLFKDLRPYGVYYAVTDGQFMGVFVCLDVRDESTPFICNFYAGGLPIFRFIEDEDEPLPDQSWAHNMVPVKHRIQNDLYDYYQEII